VFSHHCYNSLLQTAYRSMSTACVLTPSVTTDGYKQHTATYLQLVISQQLLQPTFTNSLRQHVHCLCSHTSCYNTRLQTAYCSMYTAFVLTPAVTTHVYKQQTLACPLLVFSIQLFQHTFTNSILQHVHCFCSHTGSYSRILQTAYRSMSTACVLTPAVTTQVYKQHTAACPMLGFSHQLLQHTFTNSLRQHVHCLCSHTSCYNRRLQTAHRSMSTAPNSSDMTFLREFFHVFLLYFPNVFGRKA